MSARVDKLALEEYPLEVRPNIFDSRYKTDINAKPRKAFIEGYEQAEKATIERIREQVKRWMPEKNGEEHTCGERVAFNSVLHLLEEMEKE